MNRQDNQQTRQLIDRQEIDSIRQLIDIPRRQSCLPCMKWTLYRQVKKQTDKKQTS